MEDTVFIIMVCVVMAVIAVAAVRHTQNKFKRARPFEEQYEAALRSGNETEARDAGRAYFAVLRSGKPSHYDEARINKDISAMKKGSIR